MIGARLGPYEITAAIGEGGMGEVYRGRDAALHRDVAIKILPAVLASDSERLARFKREAQVLAGYPQFQRESGWEAVSHRPQHPEGAAEKDRGRARCVVGDRETREKAMRLETETRLGP